MRKLIAFLVFCPLFSANAMSIHQAFSEGKHWGQIRLYNNTLAFQDGTKDKIGTALGGHLGFETNKEHLGGFSVGFAYYGANDLGLNPTDDANKLAPFTPTVDVDILGEAYVKWSGYDTWITAGRHKVVSPFANPADAFVVPILFTGYSLVNKSVENLTIKLHHVTRIKNRQATDFQNVGTFTTNRFGGTVQDTNGTSIVGLIYNWNALKAQAWHYIFADVMNLSFGQLDYSFDDVKYKPYVSAHYGTQSDTGDALIGTVDSSLIGAKAGIRAWGANISLGFDSISDNTFRSPFAFFTDATYTNSLITGMTNVSDGTGFKLQVAYNVNEKLWLKLSHGSFDFDTADFTMTGTDFWARYTFDGDLKGFKAELRTSYRNGNDNLPAGLAELIEYRTQLSYSF